MIRLALAIGILAVIGFAAYALAVTIYEKLNNKKQNDGIK